MKQLFQGAEAIIYQQKDSIIKERVKKSYRIEELDNKIRKQRTKKEIKLLEKASKLIPVPKVIKSSEYNIEMELIPGEKLSDSLDKLKNKNEVCEQTGKNLAILHDNNIIHGDLTTSNMLFYKNKVYFIDFGLGYESNKPEDKAVDLHLIKEALKAKHFQNVDNLFNLILKGYKHSKNASTVIKRLEAVEKRGRYKQAY